MTKMAHLMALLTLSVVLIFTSCQGYSIFVEKGRYTHMECSFPNNVSSITWQLLNGTTTVNISTCILATNSCTDQVPLTYKGSVSIPGRGMNLQVNFVKKNETSFLCVADDSPNTTSCDLVVYALPTILHLSQSIRDSYIDYTCWVDNVYPDVFAKLHRSQADFIDSDFDHNNTNCALGAPGSGADGDFSAICKWRVPTEHILLSNNITAAVSVQTSDHVLINKSALISSLLRTTFDTPRPVIIPQNCPVGTGVHLNTVLIGTEATCLCGSVLDSLPGGRVDWFTDDVKVSQNKNQEEITTNLVFSYNASDPGRRYECRAGSNLNSSGLSVFYTPEFRCSYSIVEKGQPTTLYCPVPVNVTSITWQLMNNGSVVRNISTCSLVTKNCIDVDPNWHNAFIDHSDDSLSGIYVTVAKTNETQFTYLTDTGVRSSISELEVYAWPTTPTCTQDMDTTGNVVIYTCKTSNVYPGARGVIHRRQTDFETNDIKRSGTFCKMDTNGKSSATCVFQIYSDVLMKQTSTIYIEMTASVSNLSEVHSNASFSRDIITSLDTPEAVLINCPSGSDVKDNIIKKGTSATCECLLGNYNYPGAYPQWYNDKNQKVGELSNTSQSALLKLNYNHSKPPFNDPKETFHCQPFTVDGLTSTPVKFEPKVSAAVSLQTVTGLHMMVIVLGACLSGIVSRIV